MWNSDDLANFDTCSRLMVWNRDWNLPRISVIGALYAALHAGLIAGKPKSAKVRFMELASDPGLNISFPQHYEICLHHAALTELLTDYLLVDGPKWTVAPFVRHGEHLYQPNSYMLSDGRLRRVVLCSAWDNLRRSEERSTWRTMGDIMALNRPMLINALVIGNSTKGFRPSPWTRGFIHPFTKQLRVGRKMDGEEFNKSWKPIYRERYDRDTKEWLTCMQRDEVLKDCVFSETIDVPTEKGKALYAQFTGMLDEMSRTGVNGTMRRAACFKLVPCGFAPICHATESLTPPDANWSAKSITP